jgi:dipeptidyl aminopeptidase/acylaminoacyl peptidase
MAAMLPAQNEFGPVTKIAAAIDFYGVTDVRALLEGPAKRDFAGQWLGSQPDAPTLAKRLSPLTYVRKDVPPVLAIHGDADKVVPYAQSEQLIGSLKQAGAKAELITVAGGGHGFSNHQCDTLWPQIFKWLKKMKLNA